MSKKVSIIGAGFAGLSAGCYLQMNGFDTEIYEMHILPGGLCAAWKRKEYTFDGCVHWLVGSGSGSPFNRLWREVLDMDSIEFVDPEIFAHVEDMEGNCIRVFTDADRLEQELLEKAPEDEALIKEFTAAIRKFRRFNISMDKAHEVSNFFDGIKMMIKLFPFMGDLKKWGKISGRDYANQYKNPLLRKTIIELFEPEMAFLFMIITLSWMNNRDAGYPIGGSLRLSQMFEEKYLSLGGKINYSSKVKNIITQGEAPKAQVVGVELEDGSRHEADFVISAADGHATIFDMLEGKFVDDTIRHYYDNYEIFPSWVQISLGVARTFPDVPPALIFPLDEPLELDETAKFNDLPLRTFNFDPTMAPEGKTAITVMLPTRNFDYWQNLRSQDREQYKAEKERIAWAVIEALEKKFGDVRDKVEAWDVSTPATAYRYTNNWKGTYEGWIISPEIGFKKMKKTLPGLSHFYMAGQWVEPGGGLPAGLHSGRAVAQIICKKTGKKFRS